MQAERNEINELAKKMPVGEKFLELDPALLSQYGDRMRLLGETEAMKWLIRKLEE